MPIFKKLSFFWTILVLTTFFNLKSYKVNAVDGNEDASYLQYPLTEAGNNALKNDVFKKNDEHLFDILINRFEQEKITFTQEESANYAQKLMDFAKKLSNRFYDHIDFGKSAEYYLKASQLGHIDARKKFYALPQKLKKLYSSKEKRKQPEKLLSVYLREATKEDIAFLKTSASKMASQKNIGCAAQIYLKIDALGDPEGKTLFYDILEDFKNLHAVDIQEIKNLFAACHSLIEHDEKVQSFLQENYQKSNFLQGVFLYYIQKGDEDSIQKAYDLYTQYKNKAGLWPRHLKKFINYYQSKADQGDLEACHRVIEMSINDLTRLSENAIAARYYIKASELGDANARQKLYEFLGRFSNPKNDSNTTDMRKLVTLCLQEIDKNDTDIKIIFNKNCFNPHFLEGLFSYYIQKGDEDSIQKAYALYTDYKTKAQLSPPYLYEFINYYKKKADQGDLEACHRVVEMSMGHEKYEAYYATRYNLVIDYYIKAIELGDLEAKNKLIHFLETCACGFPQDRPTKASLQWIDAQNDPELFFLMGNMYQGRFYKDHKDAATYYFKAIALGHEKAKEALKLPLERLKEIPKNNRKEYADEFVADIFPLYIREAQKDPQFYILLANEYLSGVIVPKDIAQAVEYYCLAGNIEDPSLETILFQNVAIQSKEEFEKSKEIYLVQGERSSMVALMLMQSCLTTGYDNQQEADYAKAEEYFQKAATIGDALFYTFVAKMHSDGHPYFRNKFNFGKAAECYAHAEELGDATARSKIHALIPKLQSISNTNQKRSQASMLRTFFEEEKKQDNLLPFALDAALYEAEGDYDHAITYYLKAAHATKITEDIKKWIQKAEELYLNRPKSHLFIKEEAENNNPHAAFCMAQLSDNEQQKLDYYLKAAKWGHPDALKIAEEICALAHKKYPNTANELYTSLLEYYLECADNGDETLFLKIAVLYETYMPKSAMDEMSEYYGRALDVLIKNAEYTEAFALYDILNKKPFTATQKKKTFRSIFALDLSKMKEADPTIRLQLADAYTFETGATKNLKHAAILLVTLLDVENVQIANQARIKFYTLYSFAKQNSYIMTKLLPLYQIEADKGDAKAQYIMGKCYANGYGVQKDFEKAKEWYEKSWNNKNERAAYKLGQLYESGKLQHDKNDEHAFNYYLQGKSQKGIEHFFTPIDLPAFSLHPNLPLFQSSFDIFHTSFQTLSLYTQLDAAIQNSPLGQELAAIEAGISALADVNINDLTADTDHLLIEAKEIQREIPTFLESVTLLGHTYVSIGEKNCNTAKCIEKAFSNTSLQNKIDAFIIRCQNGIAQIENNLAAQMALSVGNPDETRKYLHMVESQKRLEENHKRLVSYVNALEALKHKIQHEGPLRNKAFLEKLETNS